MISGFRRFVRNPEIFSRNWNPVFSAFFQKFCDRVKMKGPLDTISDYLDAWKCFVRIQAFRHFQNHI
ncbi:MAG: hypothetical protein CMN32_12995 [Saprospirales bacterium]|nr:hypothetical protein [Saprospirales bacterium]